MLKRVWPSIVLGLTLLLWLSPFASASHRNQPTLSSSDAITTLPAYYSFTKTVTVTNKSSTLALNVNAHVVLLAPQTSYSTVSLASASVKPSSTHYDQFGNLIGVYTWPEIKPGQSKTIVLHYVATSSNVSYKLPTTYPAYNTHSAIYKEFTNPQLEYNLGVNTDAPPLKALDRQITNASQNPYQKADAIFQWIVHNINYNYTLQASGSAIMTLKTHLGICSDFADLYTALLRTDHIPAELVGGYVTNNGAGQGGFHQWVEFYLPSVGWVVADPTWGRLGYFAALQDNWHIPLYDGIRQDISVHWYYSTAGLTTAQANKLSNQIQIGYHYSFRTTQAPAVAAPVKPRPILSVKSAPAVKAHPLPLWKGIWVTFSHWISELIHHTAVWLGWARPKTSSSPNYWPKPEES